MLDLKSVIRTVPDFPKPGIQYRDITTLLSDATALRQTVEALAKPFRSQSIDHVAGIDARGFIFGTAVAIELGAGFVPVRKAGKLPFDTYEQDYDLEYGTDTLQIHADAVKPGERVLLIDDLIATGGTALAGLQLLRRTQCDVLAAAFVVDLPDLGGRARLEDEGVDTHCLVAFSGH